MNIDAMKLALEALEEYQRKGAPFLSCDTAADALRQAIAKQAQPAAWKFTFNNGKTTTVYKETEAAKIRRYLEVDEQEEVLCLMDVQSKEKNT